MLLQNFINGKWVESSSREQMQDLNPANTREVLCASPLSAAEEARAAVAAAKNAFFAWSHTPAPVRGKILFHALDILRTRANELAETLTREEGKIIADSRGEVQRAMNILEFTAGEGRRLGGATIPSELPNNFIYTLRQPIGVVALITPWNFPVAIPIWKIAPALVAGNTIVFKPAELTPLCAVRLVEIFEEAGIPPGVLNLVLGHGHIVGEELVNHPDVRAISFTGSNEVGGSIYAKGSQRGIRVQCEMGGKNPAVILDDADLPLAVEGVVQGGFGSTGQRCTASSRVIVQETIADRFVEMLMARMKQIRVGDGLNPEVNMGPLVDESQLQTVTRYLEIGESEGAKLLTGGNRLTDANYAHGFFIAPTLFDCVKPEMKIAREEIFGPVVGVLRAKSFEECVDLANSVDYGLSASLYSTDISRCLRFVELAEVGKVHINSPTIGGEAQAPFGGTKATAIGPHEMGTEVFEFYTETKTVYMDFTGRKRESSLY
ncbi:aldehyde dehydrogenase family protein [bacterium]|nr:aldehyde dehydrogenase family protein [bacterium]MCI0614049.1 aldehyde dehydrogenase family protein [bacterium]